MLGIGDKEGKLIDCIKTRDDSCIGMQDRSSSRPQKSALTPSFQDQGLAEYRIQGGERPKTFEIDCLVSNDADEVD